MIHDEDDFELWVLFAPTDIGGWAGVIVVVAWISVGFWWFS